LIVINLAGERFELYDSMLGFQPKHAPAMHQVLRKWLYAVATGCYHKNDKVAATVLKWELEVPAVETYPQQHNGYDCGMYMVKFVQQLALGRRVQDCPKWSALDAAAMRARMALELVDEGLHMVTGD
jgi:Ulp1 family protease